MNPQSFTIAIRSAAFNQSSSFFPGLWYLSASFNLRTSMFTKSAPSHVSVRNAADFAFPRVSAKTTVAQNSPHSLTSHAFILSISLHLRVTARAIAALNSCPITAAFATVAFAIDQHSATWRLLPASRENSFPTRMSLWRNVCVWQRIHCSNRRFGSPSYKFRHRLVLKQSHCLPPPLPLSPAC